jgi:hypothetical protein
MSSREIRTKTAEREFFGARVRILDGVGASASLT